MWVALWPKGEFTGIQIEGPGLNHFRGFNVVFLVRDYTLIVLLSSQWNLQCNAILQ